MKSTVLWDITSVKLFYRDEEDRRFLQNMSAYLWNLRAHITEDHIFVCN